MDATTYHACGGTILAGGMSVLPYLYCDRCHAFILVDSLEDDAEVPDGTDKGANQAAWDDGEKQSPAA